MAPSKGVKDVDTYCIFSWQLVVSAKFLQIFIAVEALEEISIYTIAMISVAQENTDDPTKNKLLKIIDFAGLLNPYQALLYIVWTNLFLEWISMWFLVHIQRGKNASEILYDLNNPA